jgi:hypothetical protein
MNGRVARLLRAIVLVSGLGSLLAIDVALARPGMRGPGGQCPHGGGMQGEGGPHQDMQGIHALFANREQIRRTVREIPGGVETVTESDDPAVAEQIRQHVAAMYQRLKEHRPIHAGDPLFAELFRNADSIKVDIQPTSRGLKVVETARQPGVTALIRRHAQVVSAFLANGHQEMMRAHEPPPPGP